MIIEGDNDDNGDNDNHAKTNKNTIDDLRTSYTITLDNPLKNNTLGNRTTNTPSTPQKSHEQQKQLTSIEESSNNVQHSKSIAPINMTNAHELLRLSYKQIIEKQSHEALKDLFNFEKMSDFQLCVARLMNPSDELDHLFDILQKNHYTPDFDQNLYIPGDPYNQETPPYYNNSLDVPQPVKNQHFFSPSPLVSSILVESDFHYSSPLPHCVDQNVNIANPSQNRNQLISTVASPQNNFQDSSRDNTNDQKFGDIIDFIIHYEIRIFLQKVDMGYLPLLLKEPRQHIKHVITLFINDTTKASQFILTRRMNKQIKKTPSHFLSIFILILHGIYNNPTNEKINGIILNRTINKTIMKSFLIHNIDKILPDKLSNQLTQKIRSPITNFINMIFADDHQNIRLNQLLKYSTDALKNFNRTHRVNAEFKDTNLKNQLLTDGVHFLDILTHHSLITKPISNIHINEIFSKECKKTIELIPFFGQFFLKEVKNAMIANINNLCNININYFIGIIDNIFVDITPQIEAFQKNLSQYHSLVLALKETIILDVSEQKLLFDMLRSLTTQANLDFFSNIKEGKQFNFIDLLQFIVKGQKIPRELCSLFSKNDLKDIVNRQLSILFNVQLLQNNKKTSKRQIFTAKTDSQEERKKIDLAEKITNNLNRIIENNQ
jgi:hypothetical protein